VCVVSALCRAEESIRLSDLPDVAIPGTPEKKMATAKLPVPPETPIPPKAKQPEPKRTPLEQRLIEARKESRPIPVTAATFSKHEKPIAKTPNDGRKVIDRRGTVAKNPTGRGWVFTFENGPEQVKEIPRRLLPCRLLEKVEEVVAKTPKTRFEISAEITTEKKGAVRQEYLLLRRVSVITSTPTVVAPPAPKPVETPEKTPATPAVSGDNTDALREQLLSSSPGKALAVSTAPETRVEQQQSVAPIDGAAEPTRRSAVVDRTAHIVDDPKRRWAEARFVGDNTLREPPMRLLPCILLDRARQLQSKMGQRDRKFRISGEVTHYRGRRYLLLRKVLLERDMGQF
jgi:hypothetical protein